MEVFDAIIGWKYWDAVLSFLVIIHLISEYSHYIWEFISGRKKANILEDIQNHRMKSTKTARLMDIQRDMKMIKKELGISDKI